MDRKDKTTKVKKTFQFDPLDVTESLGYKTYRKNGRNSWTKEDDNQLRTLLNRALIDLGFPNGTDDIKSIQESETVCKRVSWEDIAALFKNSPRKPKELRKRWASSLDPNLKRGKWAPEEDDLLLKAYAKHGPHWLNVAGEISGRTEDQCAKRYVEILGPSSEGRLRKWTLEEDLSLVSKVKNYGTKWRRISSELESRPSLTCRNRWRKIVTSVVRGQAPPEIVKAVKENQDIDSLVNSLRAKVQEKGKAKEGMVKTGKRADLREEVEAIESPSMTKSSDSSSHDLPRTLRAHSIHQHQGAEGEHDSSKENDRQVVAQALSTDILRAASGDSEVKVDPAAELGHHELMFRGPLPGNEHFPKETTTSYEAISKSSLEGKQTTAPLKGLTPFAERMSSLSSHMDREAIPAVLDGSPLLPNVYSRESAIRVNHNVPMGQQMPDSHFNPLSSTSQDMNKSPTEGPGRTEWKFTLKDGQGLSITSGSISNSDLVKELIEQAKKFSLKISLHQHIHHHYGGQTDQDCINSNGSEPMAGFRANRAGSSAPAVGPPSSGNDFFTSTHYYKASFGSVGNNSDFFSQEANYNIFGLEPSPQPVVSHMHGHAALPHNNQIVHHNHSPVGYPSGPGTTSPTASHSTGNNDDVPDITSHRGSHFNYLPATVRPQLESSDSTRSTNISRLLNPSPNSGKKKRKRRKSLQSDTSANSGGRNSVRPSPSSTSSKHKLLESATVIGGPHDEEEPDFWESLRSLAGKPQEEEESSYSYHPYDDDDYDILYSLFDDKAENVNLDTVEKKTSGDKDHIIPFNPS